MIIPILVLFQKVYINKPLQQKHIWDKKMPISQI